MSNSIDFLRIASTRLPTGLNIQIAKKNESQHTATTWNELPLAHFKTPCQLGFGLINAVKYHVMCHQRVNLHLVLNHPFGNLVAIALTRFYTYSENPPNVSGKRYPLAHMNTMAQKYTCIFLHISVAWISLNIGNPPFHPLVDHNPHKIWWP